MKILFALLLMALTLDVPVLFAGDLPVSVQKASPREKEVLEKLLKELSSQLSSAFKAGLPSRIVLNVEKLSPHQTLPDDLCKASESQTSFVYGEYNQRSNTLTLNQAVVNELVKGPQKSKSIPCQHKKSYDQALSTIVHELAHAFDFNGKNISSSLEFQLRAGFKKGLLRTKNRNKEAMRPADPYELQNAQESFAVNAEYFFLDPEFACRRPAMFDYLKSHFGDDFPAARRCEINRTVMMSTNAGFFPVVLDPARVYRIDYLLASPGKDLSSGFGHSMFRLVMCAPEHFDPITNKMVPATAFGKKCLEDKLYHLVVSYRANVEDATLNYLKGLFGGYPSMMFILNFSDVLDEYNRDELRDVVSYPLNLSSQERAEILNKILEEHWNYRGDYKFITNNCAVESYTLLKSSLDRSQMNRYHSVSPKGVLEDLDRLNVVSLKNNIQEVYLARTAPLIQAYQSLYKNKAGRERKNEKEALLDFIQKSDVLYRRGVFNAFKATPIMAGNLHDQTAALKNQLILASSFSVLEQQILRSKSSEFRKKAADLMMNAQDEKTKEIIQKVGASLKQNLTDFAQSGYGVPLAEDMLSSDQFEERARVSAESMSLLEEHLKDKMPEEFKILSGINANIDLFNQFSLELRKTYRASLETYVGLVLKNLLLNDQTRALLTRALSSKADLDRVRNLLDPALVSEKEILDLKLRKIITDILAVQ